MRDLIQHICDRLGKGQPVATATIIRQQGSSPRGAGSKMVIDADGSIQGTIGGGQVEARAITAALSSLNTGESVMLDFDLSGDVMRDMDMVCGGCLQVLIEPIDSSGDELALWSHLARCIRERRRVFLVRCRRSVDPTASPERFVLHADGSTLGGRNLGPHLPARLLTRCDALSSPLEVALEGRTFWVEPFRSPETVYLFGAGHVSQQVAAMAATTGFQVVVLDDRPEFANRRRFALADDVRVVGSFDDAFQQIQVDRHAYIVIVTRGHLHDRVVLEQAVKTRAAYIGMIGSRRKRDALYRALMDQGVSAEALERVFCPIGMDIGAETPEEIAVSIVAELVSVRAQALQHRDGQANAFKKPSKASLGQSDHSPAMNVDSGRDPHTAVPRGGETI